MAGARKGKRPGKAEVFELGLFRLKTQKEAYMRAAITATTFVEIDFSGKKENSQADLKAVYDSGPQYQNIIQAPEKYIAPWQKPL